MGYRWEVVPVTQKEIRSTFYIILKQKYDIPYGRIPISHDFEVYSGCYTDFDAACAQADKLNDGDLKENINA